MKCGGCPMECGSCAEEYVEYPHWGACAQNLLPDSCHLTPDHQRIIDAMIRGVFDCGHCGKKTGYRPDAYVLCTHGLDPQYVRLDRFCPAWQEREEGEDGS